MSKLTSFKQDSSSELKQAALFYRKKKYEKAAAIYQLCINTIKEKNKKNREIKKIVYSEELTYLDQLEYVLSICLLESEKYEDLWNAYSQFIILRTNYGINFPAIFYAAAKTYIKMYNFPLAIKEIDNGITFLHTGKEFKHYCFPETDIVIEETTRRGLLFKLNCIYNDCTFLYKPDARCNLSIKCKNILPTLIFTTTIQEGSTAIYYKDPNFKGMVTLTCTNDTPCILQYHWICWEFMKELYQITDNKDIFYFDCFTRNCSNKGIPNKIMQIKVMGADGRIIENFTSERKHTKSSTEETNCRNMAVIHPTMFEMDQNETDSFVKELEKIQDKIYKITFFTLTSFQKQQQYEEDEEKKPTNEALSKIIKQEEASSSHENPTCSPSTYFAQQNTNELHTILDASEDHYHDAVTTMHEFLEDIFSNIKQSTNIPDIIKTNELSSCSKNITTPSPSLHFEDHDRSSGKSLNSSSESKSSRSRSRSSNKSSPFKHAIVGGLSKMKKNVEKLPTFFKCTSNTENNESLSTKHLSKNDEKKEKEKVAVICPAISPEIKRKILFDIDSSDRNENNKDVENDMVHKSHQHATDELVASEFIDFNKLEIATVENESLLLSKRETFSADDKETKKYNSKEKLSSLSQEETYIKSLEHDYYVLCTQVEDIAIQLERKVRIVSVQEIKIDLLNKKVEQLTRELTVLKNQSGVDDSTSEQKIAESSLQKWKILNSEFTKELKTKFTHLYKWKLKHQRKKIEEKNKKIMLEYELKNIELQKNLEIKEKKLAYIDSKLESTNKEFFEFKSKIFLKRLQDEFEKSMCVINKNISLYNVAINVTNTIKEMFRRIFGEKIIFMTHELQSWLDNIAFLKKEYILREEEYLQATLELNKKEYINENDDIPHIEYKIPLISITTLSAFVENAFMEFYNKLTEKWCQNITFTTQDEKTSVSQNILSVSQSVSFLPQDISIQQNKQSNLASLSQHISSRYSPESRSTSSKNITSEETSKFLVTPENSFSESTFSEESEKYEDVEYNCSNDSSPLNKYDVTEKKSLYSVIHKMIDNNDIDIEKTETPDLQTNDTESEMIMRTNLIQSLSLIPNVTKQRIKEKQDNILTSTPQTATTSDHYEKRCNLGKVHIGSNISAIAKCDETNLVQSLSPNRNVTEYNEEEDNNTLTSTSQVATTSDHYKKYRNLGKVDIGSNVGAITECDEYYVKSASVDHRTDLSSCFHDNEKATTSGMNLTSDKEVILNKSDKNDINYEEIASEFSKASNKSTIIRQLSDDSDSMKNLSPKEKKSGEVITIKPSNNNDNMKDLSPKEKKSEEIIVTGPSDNNDKMKNLSSREEKNDIVIYNEKQTKEGVMTSKMNLAIDETGTLSKTDKDNAKDVKEIVSKSNDDVDKMQTSSPKEISNNTDCKKPTDEGATTSGINRASDEKSTLNKANEVNDDSNEEIIGNKSSKDIIEEIIYVWDKAEKSILSKSNESFGEIVLNELDNNKRKREISEKENIPVKKKENYITTDCKTQTNEEITTNEINRASDNNATLNRNIITKITKIVKDKFRLEDNKILKQENPFITAEKNHIITKCKKLIDIEKMMIYFTHDNIFPSLNMSNMNKYTIIPSNNKMYSNMSRIYRRYKDIYLKKISTEDVPRVHRKCVEREMNAINELLSLMLEKFPNFSNIDILFAIMWIKEAGMKISNTSQNIVIEELRYFLSRYYKYCDSTSQQKVQLEDSIGKPENETNAEENNSKISSSKKSI